MRNNLKLFLTACLLVTATLLSSCRKDSVVITDLNPGPDLGNDVLTQPQGDYIAFGYRDAWGGALYNRKNKGLYVLEDTRLLKRVVLKVDGRWEDWYVELSQDAFEKSKHLRDLFPSDLLQEPNGFLPGGIYADVGEYSIKFQYNGQLQYWVFQNEDVDRYPQYAIDYVNEIDKVLPLLP